MEKKLSEIIEGLGLHKREAAVYLACLEVDGSANSSISQKTGLNRITNYEILKRLEKRGYVKSFLHRGARHYSALDPRDVIQQVRNAVSRAEAVLPELLSTMNQLSKKPKVYYVEGINGIQRIYQDSLTARTDILTFTNPKDIRQLLGDDFIDRYVQERVKRKIPVRGLAPDDVLGQHEAEIAKKVLRQIRLFPADKYSIQYEIMIYDNKIALYSGKDALGLIIENAVLAQTFRSIWDMAWDGRPALR